MGPLDLTTDIYVCTYICITANQRWNLSRSYTQTTVNLWCIQMHTCMHTRCTSINVKASSYAIWRIAAASNTSASSHLRPCSPVAAGSKDSLW